jgi:hypothetical protein
VATPVAGSTPAPPPPTTSSEPFTGTWRIVDTVTSGSGAGSVFTFDVVLVQSGSVVEGGGGGLQIFGTVDGQTAQVQFSQPAQGYVGAFAWTLSSPDRAAGSFTTSGLNSGTSELIRLD